MFNKMKCRRNCGNSRFSFGSARTCIHLESNPLQFGRHYQLGCRLLLPDWHWRTGSWSISIWNCSSIATLKQTTFVPSLREAPSRGISCWCRNPNSTVVCFTPMFDTVRQIKHVLCKTKYFEFKICFLLLIIIIILIEWRGVIPNHTCTVLVRPQPFTSLHKRKDSPLDSLLFSSVKFLLILRVNALKFAKVG
jgi:hypothetical protein